MTNVNEVSQATVPQKKKHRGCLISAIVVLAFIGLSVWGITTQVDVRTPIQKVVNVTADEEGAIKTILSDCGIKKVDAIVPDTSLNNMNQDGEKGYRLTAEGVKNIILYVSSENTVSMVRYADNDLYAKGKVLSTIQDYSFTLTEQSKYQSSCQEAIKKLLKSPSTAKFPLYDEWKFGKNKGTITIQSYVDSQNSFGATIRAEFQFKIDVKSSNITSLIFDGKEYVK